MNEQVLLYRLQGVTRKGEVHWTVCADEHQFGGLSAPNDLKGFEMPREFGPKSNVRCKLLIVNRITALSRFAEPFQNLSNHFKMCGGRHHKSCDQGRPRRPRRGTEGVPGS